MKAKTAIRISMLGLVGTGMLPGCGIGLPNSLKTYEQNGPSMEPAIQIGDVITRSDVGTPYRGEVVFVNSAVAGDGGGGVTGSGPLIKRIVGLPGETISSADGVVTINGRRLAEPYLAAGTPTENLPTMKVPAGEYYLLGDNRGSSYDSRYFGTVQRVDLIGSSHRIIRPSKHAGRIKGT